MKKDVIFIILVRGGSKGIKNKNLSIVGEETLLGHAIRQAIESGLAARIIVSSDCSLLLDHALLFPGVEIVKRPAELANDTALSIDAQIHALKTCKVTDHTMVVNLQVTSPLRRAIHIRKAVQILRNNGKGSIVSVSHDPKSHHPYKIFIQDGEGNDGSPIVKPIIDYKYFSSPRQLLPKFYNVNGAIYGNYADELIAANSYYIEPVKIFEMPADLSADIDTPEDLEEVREIYKMIQQSQD